MFFVEKVTPTSTLRIEIFQKAILLKEEQKAEDS